MSTRTNPFGYAAISCCLLVAVSVASAQYGGGRGTRSDPYRICTAEQMNEIGLHEEDWGQYFKLMVDIDLAELRGAPFNIIGTHLRPFSGVINGNGKAVSNFTYVSEGRSFVGLIGVLGRQGQIRDLRLVTPHVDAGSDGAVGGLVGWLLHGTVRGCRVEGGSVEGNVEVGGLVGTNDKGDIVNCHSSTRVVGSQMVGGLVGCSAGDLFGCQSAGTVEGDDDVGGLVGWNIDKLTCCSSTGAVDGRSDVGGLVGYNDGDLVCCCSTGTVSGVQRVGGLTGTNEDTAEDCYAAGAVAGEQMVGGLVGKNGRPCPGYGKKPYIPLVISNCYSVGAVTGKSAVGGLIGYNECGLIGESFWDIETSGRSRSQSDGGEGMTTVQMQAAGTFLAAGWDFVDGAQNGTADVWWMPGDPDYPVLAWELRAFCPYPPNGSIGVAPSPTLDWCSARRALGHDIYFGEDADAVANATTQSAGVYCDRQSAETTGYDPGPLEWGKTYYWRIDEVLDFDDSGAGKGPVWAFTVAAGFVTSPSPWDGATGVEREPVLGWVPGQPGLHYDVYFGGDRDVVADATVESASVYRGRYAPKVTTYAPGRLDWARTYYWRIDGVDDADPQNPLKGDVWSFSTIGLIVACHPPDGAIDVSQSPILSWTPGGSGLEYDVYFGADEETVVEATPETPGIYRGRQPQEMTTYEPGDLKRGKTYYWRIDGVNDVDPNSPWRGQVWSFTTGDFLLVDDFESYTDEEGERIWEIWVDGWDDPTNGSIVGFGGWWGRPTIVHGGEQSMPFYYENSDPATYSQATANVEHLVIGPDWTRSDAEILSLWFYGDAGNAPEPMYVALTSANGPAAAVYYHDASAPLAEEWTQWKVPLKWFSDQGVVLTEVETISIGLGDRSKPALGSSGDMYFDDIRLYRSQLPIAPFALDSDRR